ncbi:MAG: DNA primase DnaG [Methanocellales archaeon]|nr:DNA primase DnaG [Methanocellales archaeon]MDD3421463.1 DNA primase DnaG [Methanocellales archaeon]MDD4898667.1 DNA primase DnaG [Methanocellales archaeon]MDD5447345.1 DNA primase DnaG [Methanocellales archaeon]
MQNSDTTKYIIRVRINAEGVVEKPDVVGAVFGQTEGLLSEDLDLRNLQKTGRIGRIEVNIDSKAGKSTGTILIPSSLDKVETAILAAAIETIDRVGPCVAELSVEKVEDIRETKRKQIIDRAKHVLSDKFDLGILGGQEITESVRQAVRIEKITSYGDESLPAGPNVLDSDAILIVEGRADVMNLLRYGIKNAVAVEGTNVPLTIGDLSRKKTVTVFLDGDRGGDLILKELLQMADIDYVARAPDGKGVEELTQKEIVKSLRNKVPVEQAIGNGANRRTKSSKRRILRWKPPKKEDELKAYAEELNGTLSAKLLNSGKKVIKEVAVRDLANVLKESDNVKGVVFDGVITQRILDIAAEKNLEYIVGVKLGNIVKKPLSVKVLTASDL